MNRKYSIKSDSEHKNASYCAGKVEKQTSEHKNTLFCARKCKNDYLCRYEKI